MEKYRFSVDGISVSILPVMDPDYPRENILLGLEKGELGVVLLPDRDADFRMECFDKNNSEPIILPFSWEINDDVFNMIVSDFGETNKMGFVIEDGILTSVNGEDKFEKVEK